jgi:hypothetical protein
MEAPPPVCVIEGASEETGSSSVEVGSASCVDVDGPFCSSEGLPVADGPPVGEVPSPVFEEVVESALVGDGIAADEDGNESESCGAVTDGSGSDGAGKGTCSGGPAPITPGSQVGIIIPGSTVGGS